MNVRLENIHTNASPTNYVSFLSQAQRNKTRASDRDSIHSVSSVRSVMSSMSSFWQGFGISNSTAKSEKQKAAIQEDLKYLYSAFTKVPCLRLAPDHKARLISGYEEFPFDTAVPLFAFKNLSALEIYDVDFRQFYGWDRLADQLRSLTIKRGGLEDLSDLLINIVLDDMDKRRRRSAKVPSSPVPQSPGPRRYDLSRSDPGLESPISEGRRSSGGSPPSSMSRTGSGASKGTAHRRQRSMSPTRPVSARHGASFAHSPRNTTPQLRRSSGSSNSSGRSATPRGSSSNLLTLGGLPSTKWRFLRHLSLADNGLTTVSASSLAPLADTLQSLDLSSNLFVEVPDQLATLISLRALNLSNCMISSLHSLARNPLPAIATLNLRGNRLTSLAGVQRLLSLERVDLRENRLTDPTELARLTELPLLREIYVSRNPFVKTHSNYRVTIFNLFRSTPGYAEDIMIDGDGPGYSERKMLVDRAPERPNVPVVKPVPVEEFPISKPTRASVPERVSSQAARHGRKHTSEDPERTPRRSDSYAGSTHRRKKGPRRRVVELSQNDGTPQVPSDPVLSAPSQSSADSTYGSSTDRREKQSSEQPAESAAASERPTLDTSVSSTSAKSLGTIPTLLPSVDLSAGGDTYKKRIEALRNDFGDNWLSALADEPWDGNQQRPAVYPDLSFSPTLRPTGSTTRTPSQGIVSGGRTLG